MSKPLLSEMDGCLVQSPKHYVLYTSPKNYDTTLDGPEFDPAGSSPKLFHLPSVSDNEDSPYDKDIPCLPEVTSPEGSWSDHSVNDFLDKEKDRDALRKFHALKELLATEVGYLSDLKALVTVTIFDFSSEN